MKVSSVTKRPPLQEWTPDKGQVVERPDSFEKIE